MAKLIHCITAGLWVLVPGLQVSAQEMASLHHAAQDGDPMTEGLLSVFVLFAALTLCAALTDGLKRGLQRRPFLAGGKAGWKTGRTIQSDNPFWRDFSIKRSAMLKLTGCMTVGLVLLGSAPGATGQSPDKIEEFLSSALVGNLGKLKELVADGMDVNAQAPEQGSGFVHGTTALHLAVSGNRLAMVSFLMSKGANPGIKNAGRVTPLHQAAEKGYAAITKALLKADSGVVATFAKDAKGRTPLHLAVVSDGDTVTALLEAGADVHMKDNDGRTPLQYGKSKADAKGLAVLTSFLDYMVYYFVEAASLGNIPKLKRLLLNGIKVDAQNGGGNNLIKGVTALHGAAASPQPEAVRFLLGQGANPNIADVEGKTPLHRAAENGHTSIVTTLLEAGANVHVTDKSGKTPEQLAQNKGHASLAARLLDFARALPKKLWDAVSDGDASLIKRLIKNGVDVNAKDRIGETALHRAVRKPSHTAVAISALLTATNINMDAKNNDGWTPLHIAAEFNLTEAIKALLAGGSNAESQGQSSGYSGSTPLMLAALHGHTAAVKALLDGGADAKGTDRYSSTALHVAAYMGRTDIIPLLLKSGADVNAKDVRGKTPLHGAAEVGRTAVVKALLAAGADVDAKDKNGRTAQQYALENGHTSIAPLLGNYVPPAPQKLWDAIKADDPDEVRRLIRLGVDVNARGRLAFPALHMTLYFGAKDPNLEIVHLLLANGADATLTVVYRDRLWQLHRGPALHLAAHYGLLAAAELFLAYDATLVTRQFGNTALHVAAQEGDRALVELMVAYWPDVLDSGNGAQIDPNNPPDREASISNKDSKYEEYRKTPRQLALENGHEDVAEALNGLEAFTRNAELHQAITGSDDPDLVKALLNQGTSVETRSNLLANTPLHTAVLANRTAVARFLLAKGASTEARNASGDTPLHYAALTANAEIAAILLNEKADADARNVQGKTPLHYATSMGAEDVKQKLLDAGADTTIEDWDGKTP